MLFAVAPFIVWSQVKDTIWLYNDTKLIGELKNIKLGRLQFDASDVGLVNIKYDKVKSMRASMHPYRIETTAKQLLFGTIEPSSKTGFVYVVADKSSIELMLANISVLSYYGKNWKNRLTGNASLGYSYTRQSNIGRLNYSGTLRYLARRWEMVLSANSIVTKDSIKRYRERDEYSATGQYFLNQKWFAGASGKFQRNAQLGIDHRWQEGIAIGSKYITTVHTRGSALTGPVLNQEKSIDGNGYRFLWEWVLQANFNFFSFNKPRINLSLNESSYFGLTQTNRIRLDGDFKADWELIDNFTLNTSFYHNFDSKSPANDASRSDFGIVFGVGYTF